MRPLTPKGFKRVYGKWPIHNELERVNRARVWMTEITSNTIYEVLAAERMMGKKKKIFNKYHAKNKQESSGPIQEEDPGTFETDSD